MLKINKKLISLALAGTLALAPFNTLADIYLTSDYEIANSNVNVRISDNIDSKRIGGIKKGTKVERIFVSDKNWDLIRYNNTLGYVSHDYMIPLEKEEYTYVDHVEYKDTIYTNSKVNLRLGPDKSNKVIGSIPKNTELTSIAVTENNWYLVSYNGKLGYVSGDYIISAKKILKEAFNVSYDGNLDVCKIGYGSHGCVNMPLDITPKIDENVKVGTKVLVKK